MLFFFGHFPARRHAERARGCGLGLPLQRAFRRLQAALVRTRLALDSGSGLLTCPHCF